MEVLSAGRTRKSSFSGAWSPGSLSPPSPALDPIKLVVYASSSTALHEKRNSGAQGRSLHFLHKSYPRNRGGVMRDEIKMLWNIGGYIFLVSSIHLCLHYLGLGYITQYVLPAKYNLGREISQWHFSRIWPAYIEMQAEGFLVAKQGMVSAASIVLSNSALTPKLQISLSQMRALWLKRSALLRRLFGIRSLSLGYTLREEVGGIPYFKQLVKVFLPPAKSTFNKENGNK